MEVKKHYVLGVVFYVFVPCGSFFGSWMFLVGVFLAPAPLSKSCRRRPQSSILLEQSKHTEMEILHLQDGNLYILIFK